MQQRALHPNHHGFLPWHSTTAALAQVHNTLSTATEQKRMSLVVVFDQSAAFDLVDHGALTAKMSALNFSPETVCWFNDYLVGRRFSCQVESKLSDLLAVGDQ